MKITSAFAHYNFNVYDLEKSIAFYEKALGLAEKRRVCAEDKSFTIVFMADASTDFLLELTWLKNWDKPYDMGDNEVHLCVTVAEDYEKVKAYHAENGWVCYENTDMGLYFIADPDDHWIEILPQKR